MHHNAFAWLRKNKASSSGKRVMANGGRRDPCNGGQGWKARSWRLPLLRVVRDGGWLGHDPLGDVLFVKYEGKVQGRINVVAKSHVT